MYCGNQKQSNILLAQKHECYLWHDYIFVVKFFMPSVNTLSYLAIFGPCYQTCLVTLQSAHPYRTMLMNGVLEFNTKLPLSDL